MDHDLTIREARTQDLDALLAIENAAFETDRISRRNLRRLVGAPSTAVLVAEVGGPIAGYAAVLFRGRSPAARLYSIAIGADFAGRGAGRRLLAAVETEARRRGCATLRLEVRADNPRAAALYRAAGYASIGTRLEYYADGATALRFEKRLIGSEAAEEGAVP